MNSSNTKSGWFSSLKRKFFNEKDERSDLLNNLRDAQRKGVISLDSLMMIEGVFQLEDGLSVVFILKGFGGEDLAYDVPVCFQLSVQHGLWLVKGDVCQDREVRIETHDIGFFGQGPIEVLLALVDAYVMLDTAIGQIEA